MEDHSSIHDGWLIGQAINGYFEQRKAEIVDFVTIAAPLVLRGFRVTPTSPETKQGVFKNWGNHQATTVEKLEEYARTSKGKYAHFNVGVVGKRGIGRHCFLDIDAPGVIERIESETGHAMPKTYIVQSRPQSAPYKQHFYFTQTEYSFAKFGEWNSKNANVKDISGVDAEGRHPTTYDLKGIGGGSLVIGAGSVRENGEVYTAIDDSAPVLPIPDWLTDWLHEDINAYRAAKAAELTAKRAAKKLEREKFTSEQRAEMRKKSLPEGFDIFADDRYDFMRWRAGSLASLGFEPDHIEQALTWLVMKSCVGGTEYLQSERGKATVHRLAHDPTLKPGDASWFYDRKRGNEDHWDRSKPGMAIDSSRPPSRQQAMVDIIRQFPDSLSTAEAYGRLEKALQEGDAKFDRAANNDQQMVARARGKAGFKVKKRQWVRSE